MEYGNIRNYGRSLGSEDRDAVRKSRLRQEQEERTCPKGGEHEYVNTSEPRPSLNFSGRKEQGRKCAKCGKTGLFII